MVFTALEIVLLLVFIVGCCAIFTNAIEWMGHRFNLSEGAVGSVFAAVGTALPETLVPLIAIASGYFHLSAISVGSSHEIGIGAIMGAPFLLGTLAMGVTATALYYFSATNRRELKLHVNRDLLKRDFHYFFPAYAILFAAAYLPYHPIKVALGFFLIAFYAVYVYRTLNKEHAPDAEFELPALLFAPKQAEPPTWLIMVQVFSSILILLVLVHLFVEQINGLATVLQVEPLILSLIITPIATELPEKFNSVVWIRHEKDNLAFGNITGAMVFQSCIPGAIGLWLTPWELDQTAVTSMMLCLLSTLCIYWAAAKKPSWLPASLLIGGILYLMFVAIVLTRLAR